MGHKDIGTTMIYLHAIRAGALPALGYSRLPPRQ
ncbi:MAG: hypothetical protein IIB37_13825 [Gemmatimonadetes bacterium]|nr:hypothetical protein [Gemmatimonadota bacterium]